MTGIANPGFELAGDAPGTALGWTLRSRASVEEIAGYGLPEAPIEDFERGWADNESFLVDLVPTAVEPALYSDPPSSAETFETGWAENGSFLVELASLEAARYAALGTTRPVEGFDAGWFNDAFLVALGPSELAAGRGDPFESGWRGNGAFVFTLDGAHLAIGISEGFESSWSAAIAL